MTDAVTPLILDFLEWIAKAPRPYAEVMEAWRTSCPRLQIWEEACEQGYVTRCGTRAGPVVEVTPRGLEFLRASARFAASPDEERS